MNNRASFEGGSGMPRALGKKRPVWLWPAVGTIIVIIVVVLVLTLT